MFIVQGRGEGGGEEGVYVGGRSCQKYGLLLLGDRFAPTAFGEGAPTGVHARHGRLRDPGVLLQGPNKS